MNAKLNFYENKSRNIFVHTGQKIIPRPVAHKTMKLIKI